jgi:nitrogen fixation NifU-like protein
MAFKDAVVQIVDGVDAAPTKNVIGTVVPVQTGGSSS